MTKYNESTIQELDNIDHIRLRPSMYIGHIGNNGYLKLIREVIDNSIDEMEAGNCTGISIEFNEIDNTCKVIDNGIGIPLGSLNTVFLNQNSSAKFNTDIYRKKIGLNGVGLKAVSALSEFVEATSTRNGKSKSIVIQKGRLVSESEIYDSNAPNGVSVRFKPDSEILGSLSLEGERVVYMIKWLSYILPNKSFYIKCIKSNNKIIERTFNSNKGILDGIQELITKKSVYQPVYIKSSTSEIEAEVTIAHDIGNESIEIISYANNVLTTSSGTHEEGLVLGLTSFMSDYIKKNLLKEKEKLTIRTEDCTFGLKAIVNISYIGTNKESEGPIFQGQAKEELTNESAKNYINIMVRNALREWSIKNIADCKRIAEIIKKVAKSRENNKKATTKAISRNYSNFSKNLPKSFLSEIRGDYNELFLVEGGSAAGACFNARFPYQAILAFRGVGKNAFVCTPEETMQNKEFETLVTVTGTDIGKRFDSDKCRYDKIIIFTDADIDGLNIRRLLLGFYLAHAIDLLYQGRIFIVIAPLFSIKGKRGVEYIYSMKEFNEYTKQQLCENNSICDMDGSVLSDDHILEMINNLKSYNKKLNNLSQDFKLPKSLLENLSNTNFDIQAMKNIYNNNATFKMDPLNIHAEIEGQIVDIPLIPKLTRPLKELKFEKTMYNDEYLVNGIRFSLAELLDYVDEYEPKIIQRFKGLGEMDADILRETCMDPNKRRLEQLVIPDEISKNELISELNIIYGDNSQARKDMLEDYVLDPDDIDN